MSDSIIEEPVIPLPDGFTWGFVVARAIHAMADTTQDFDRFPEARGSNGRAIFTPQIRFNKHVDEPTAFVQYEIANARIRRGTLIDAEGDEGIWLISGDYDVTFQIDGGSIPGFPIRVTEEYTMQNPLDLVQASPIQVPPGYVEIVRVSDRIRAEEAAEEAEGHVETASGYVDEARQVVQTETFEGFVSDAQSARDQANQHRVSAEESANSASQDANRSETAYAGVENLLEDLPDTFENVATRDYVDTSVSGLASESYVDTSVSGLASESYVDSASAPALQSRGALPADTNVDDLYGESGQGLWYVTGTAGIQGLPKDPVQGSILKVYHGGGPLNGNKQEYTDRYESWWREAGASSSSGVTTWGTWWRYATPEMITEEVESGISDFEPKVPLATGLNMAAGTDLNDFLGNQIGYVASANSGGIVNRPPDATASGATILVYTNNSSGIQNQEWIQGIGADRSRRYVRSRTASASNWSDWQTMAFLSDVEATIDDVNDASWNGGAGTLVRRSSPNERIRVGEPSNTTDATTKSYVDNQVSSLVTVSTTAGRAVYVGEEIVSYESGNIDISHLFPGISYGQGGGVFIERSNNLVFINFAAVSFDWSGGQSSVIPFGFRPSAWVYSAANINNTQETVQIGSGRFGNVRIHGNEENDVIRGSIVYSCDEGFPPTLNF